MGKGGKSSATSATRKKHAKKAAGESHLEEQAPLFPKDKKLTKQQRAQKKKEPRVKMYIPPVKPAPVQPDPLETTGLVHRLPPELLIVLRSFNKKAQVTKIRALEELQSGWIDKCRKEGEDGALVYVLIDMLPVWLHHVPALFVHPSRRVRLLAASVHLSFVQISPVREHILSFLRDSASASQIETILGTWCLAAHDVEKSVAGIAFKSWIDVCTFVSGPRDQLLLDDTYLSPLVAFVQRTILDPNGAYVYLNPPQLVVPVPVGKKGVTRKEEPADTPRSKADEQEESDTDRKARLRIGGLGAIRRIVETLQTALPNEVLEFFKNPALWSSLYHAERCPFVSVEGFGHGQPNVRKSAWTLILSLLSAPKLQLESLLPILSLATLRSAWVDPDTTVHAVMWQPLLKFLKEFPDAWELERAHDYAKDEEGDEDSDSESGDVEPGAEKTAIESGPTVKQSTAYQEFLRFLELGCSGSSLQGYPTVVIIVSTIPSSILASSPTTPPLEALFTAFWQVLSSRALSSLQRAATSAAFLSSLLECMVFLVKRVRNNATPQAAQIDQAPPTNTPTATATVLLGPGSADELTSYLAKEQIGKVWTCLVEGELKVEHRAAARVVAQTLIELKQVQMGSCVYPLSIPMFIDSLCTLQGLFLTAWDTLSARLRDATESHPGLLSVFLKVLYDKFKHIVELREAVSLVMATSLRMSVEECNHSINTLSSTSTSVTPPSTSLTNVHEPPITGAPFLIDMLDQFREGLFEDIHFAELIDALLVQQATFLLRTSPALLLSYLAHRKSPVHCLTVWHTLLAGISQVETTVLSESVKPLMSAVQSGLLPAYLKPRECEVDSLVEALVERALVEDFEGGGVVKQVLQSPDHFLSAEGYTRSLETISSAFSHQVDLALQSDDVPPSTFEMSLGLITALSGSPPRELPKFRFDAALCDVFVLAYLLPVCYDTQHNHAVFVLARNLWEELYKTLPAETQAEVCKRIYTKLRVILCTPSFRPLPEDILEMVWKHPPGITFNLPHDIFPSAQEIDQALSHLPPDPIHPSLAVITPLIPPASAFASTSSESELGSGSTTDPDFDKRGFSSYARIVNALLHVFIEDRQIAKHNLWALRHFLALEIYTQDFISVPGDKSRVFAVRAIHAGLETLVGKMEQVITYVLTSSASEEGWREVALAVALGSGHQLSSSSSSRSSGHLTVFLVDTIQRARDSDSARDTRILRNVLQHVFYDVDKEEADRWIVLARKIEGSAPEASMAIVHAVTNFAPEPLRLDRYRNELAASLLGVPPAKANTEGLMTLRKLCACAPNTESDVVFLPQPRAVNITKACQQWITSDEEVDEEVLSAITAVFYYLAPILQDMSGGHWELIFDIVENNLEESSLADDATLVSLARTLRLVMLIQDLSLTNKSLRYNWEERKMPILTMVRNLATVSLDDLEPSIPRSTCRGLLLSIVKDLPPSLIDEGTFSKMCHLVLDPSAEVQKMAYHFLALAAKKRTEYLVIEAGVDSEGTVNMDLSGDLLNLLQRNVFVEDAQSDSSNVFGYLLAWMLLFDLFDGSSLKVRSSYIEQLRNINVVVAYFIPTILSLLRLDQGPHKAFKLDIWAVDEFRIEYYETDSTFGLSVLAAHLYYRALLTIPSLIHTWVTDCKDRQLSTSITNYTSQCFSPVIIRTELTHVKDPESTSNLVDENFTVKVVSSVNEVTASYSVDEHQLEIKLKIPPDWPLHKIEIKDLKRVGVDENRWRAWILAVQQIIWSHVRLALLLPFNFPVRSHNKIRMGELSMALACSKRT
ncbi:hypothetical protein C0989_002683 [Termitomyces sp. Mn162]|nr:hypothetical protein C0989_002683 [Termitomyces sp. Mn162]